MRRPRRWAGALLAIGMAIGTLTDDVLPRAISRSGDDTILAGDFHVHAGPGDGTLLPWDLRREADRAGLDVIGVTNHNTALAGRLAEWWTRRFPGPGAIVIAGEEITSPDYHMAAIGIHETVSPWQPAASAIEAIHAQGGVAIAAHPGRKYWTGYDAKARAALDGAEAANSPDPLESADYETFRRLALERNPDLAAIGSSDFHGWDRMGRSRTYLFARERSREGVLEALRRGRTVARDEHGRLHGPPGLVARVGPSMPAGRSDPHAGWRRLSVAFAWVGVLGLVFLRGAR